MKKVINYRQISILLKMQGISKKQFGGELVQISKDNKMTCGLFLQKDRLPIKRNHTRSALFILQRKARLAVIWMHFFQLLLVVVFRLESFKCFKRSAINNGSLLLCFITSLFISTPIYFEFRFPYTAFAFLLTMIYATLLNNSRLPGRKAG